MWIAAAVIVGGIGRHDRTGGRVPPRGGIRRTLADDVSELRCRRWSDRAGACSASALRPSGRCRHCSTPVGPPLAVVELLAAATLAVLAWRSGIARSPRSDCSGPRWSRIVLALVDVAVHRLPDRLILAALAGTLLVFASHRRLLAARYRGTVRARMRRALLPDRLRVAARHGARRRKAGGLRSGSSSGWFGVRTALFAIVRGAAARRRAPRSCFWSLRRVSRSDRIPHGPFMLLGGLAAIILATV